MRWISSEKVSNQSYNTSAIIESTRYSTYNLKLESERTEDSDIDIVVILAIQKPGGQAFQNIVQI